MQSLPRATLLDWIGEVVRCFLEFIGCLLMSSTGRGSATGTLFIASREHLIGYWQTWKSSHTLTCHWGQAHLTRSVIWLLLGLITSWSPAAELPVTALALTPDGERLLVGSQRGLQLRSIQDNGLIELLPTKLEQLHDLAFAPSGQLLLVAGGTPGERGQVEIWKWPERNQLGVISDHADVVYQVAWSPESATFTTASMDGSCLMVAVPGLQPIGRFQGHSRPVLAVRYLDSNTLISAGVDQTVRLWRLAENEAPGLLRTLDNHTGTVTAIAVSPDAKEDRLQRIATLGEDRTVRLWQPRIGRLLRFTRLPAIPRDAAWSPDGQRLFVACQDGHVHLLEAATLDTLATLPTQIGRINHLLLIPSTRPRILVGGERGFSEAGRYP